MSKSLRLLHGQITYSEAREDETNVLHKLKCWKQRVAFFDHLKTNWRLIEAVVDHHLGLSDKQTCVVSKPSDWLHGSFNLCIPVSISGWRKYPNNRVIVRFPLPYRVGEVFRPGNADEKLRCEAGAYV